jgi:hypothetical protein
MSAVHTSSYKSLRYGSEFSPLHVQKYLASSIHSLADYKYDAKGKLPRDKKRRKFLQF